MPINELRAISTFVKAAELGSLRGAAAAQGISPQAASQAVAQLEGHLGVRLFHRTTRNMALTDEGRQFLEAAHPALLGLQRAMRVPQRAKDEVAGPLRIAGPRSTFLPLLWSVLEPFCTQHPAVQPDVQLDDRVGNWVEDRVDVGFRVGTSPAVGVVARRLFPLQLVICAAPAYLARHGAPETLAALASHRCTVFRHPGTGRLLPWQVKEGDHIVDIDVVPALCTDDEGLETMAVLSGQVIGLLTGVTATAHLRTGRLVPLLTQHATDHLGIYMYYGSRSAQPARVRAFIDMALRQLQDSEAFVTSPKALAALEAKGCRAHARRAA